MLWRDNYTVPYGQRIAHAPAIDANLPEVDERELNEERSRAFELARKAKLVRHLRDDA